MPTPILRAFPSGNVILSYFTIPKSYFINYIILFYNTPGVVYGKNLCTGECND